VKLRIVEGSGGAQLSYVVGGAKLQCNFGDQPSQLKIPTDHGIDINGKPQANIMDFQPQTNIPSFGQCGSLDNPAVKSATRANRGRLKKQPCMPNINMPWINGKPDKLVDQQPALTTKSTNMCMWCGRITVEDDGQEG
jgi:hypothetical protein